MAQPYLWCKCYDLFLLYAHFHLLRVLDDFGEVRIPYLCTPQQCMNIWELLHVYLELLFWISRLLLFFVEMFRMILSFCNLWISAFVFTDNLSNAHLLEELLLYWPSKFFFPFWQWMPMGEKFRGFKGIWVLCFCCICL